MSEIICLKGINMVREGRTILSDINLAVNSGDFLAITGPNGGGKTTLLRIILKLVAPTSGQVKYYSGGDVVKQLSIGYLPQKNSIDSRFPLTVREVIRSGLMQLKNIDKQEVSELTERMLTTVCLESKADSLSVL